MLDKLGIKLLKAIKQMCNADSYSILECAEIIAAVSKDMDNETLKRYIDYFVSQGYIDVKKENKQKLFQIGDFSIYAIVYFWLCWGISRKLCLLDNRIILC